jgi:hypothetical protein
MTRHPRYHATRYAAGHRRPRPATSRSVTWRSTLRKFTRAVITVTIALATTITAWSPAQAADYITGEWGTYGGANTFWGNMSVGGVYGMCIDPGAEPPSSLTDANATRVCGTFTNGKPDMTAQIAYVLARHLHDTDKATLVSLSQFSRGEYHSGIPITYPARYGELAQEAATHGGPKAAYVQVDLQAAKIWVGLVREGEPARITSGTLARADAHYTPGYLVTVTITTPNVKFTDGTKTKTLTTGAVAAGLGFTTNHDLIAGEQVTVTITIGDVPAACFNMHQNTGTQRVLTPLFTTLAGRDTATQDKTVWEPVITTQMPSTVITRTIAATKVEDKVKATAAGGSQWPVKVWADADQTKAQTYFPFTASGDMVKATVPPAPSKTLPPGATLVSTAPTLVTLTGPDVWATATTTVPDAGSGHYAMRWCLDRTHQGDLAKYLPDGGPFCDTYFATTERFVIPMTLAVASALPDQYQAKGESPDDTITLTLPNPKDQWIATAAGNPAIVTVTGTYYAGSASSFTIQDTPPADAKALGTAAVKVTLPTAGRAPVTVPAPADFTVPTSQYGTWVWKINRADQPAEVAALLDNDPADKFGQTLETHVTQMDLTIQSHVVHPTIPEPVGKDTIEVCDTVWVEHTSPGDLWLNQWGTTIPVEVTVDGTLYHSAVPGPQTLAVDPAIPAIDAYTLTFTAAGKDHAQSVCHTATYGNYGAYGFVFSIDLARQPTATKDYLAHGVTTPLWLPEETTMVRRTPVIHTTATDWPATVGGEEQVFFQDDIWQIDWPDGPEDTALYGATGHTLWPGYGPWEPDVKTVTTQLWRIEGDITADSCSTDNPKATLVATNTATPALNTWAGAHKVSGSRFKAEGTHATYTFVISHPGDARTEPYRSICGEKTETITIKPDLPHFITQLVTADNPGHTDLKTATSQTTGLTVEPGTQLVDALHIWYPDDEAKQADMTGWHVTWQAYWNPTDDADPLPTIVADPAGGQVYAAATCTPDTLLTALEEPVPVTKPGTYTSSIVTMPKTPGLLLMVETITDTSGPIPTVIRRGACGAVAETAILTPPETPTPRITTKAPEHAALGTTITDEAILVGPFEKGTHIEFWYQHTIYTNPGAAQADLACIVPDPDAMDGAVRIGTIVLDHATDPAITESIHSPEFTVDKEGCTWVKEIAYTPDGTNDRAIITQGRFDTVNERTMWHATPRVGPPSSPELPFTGGVILPWAVAGGGSLVLGVVFLLAARVRSRWGLAELRLEHRTSPRNTVF